MAKANTSHSFLRIYIFKIVFISFLLGVSKFMLAQKEWSLEDCINYAIENNLEIKQQQLQVKTQSNRLKQSKFALIPTLDASFSRNFSFGRSIDRFINDFTDNRTYNDNYSINSSVTLFNGFQKINTIKKNKLDLKAQLEDVEALKYNTSLKIVSAYLEVLFNAELLTTAQKQIEISTQQIERTQTLFDEGAVNKEELLRVKVQKSNEELQAIQYLNRQKSSFLTLKQMLELDTLEGFRIKRNQVDVEHILLPASVDEIYQKAQAQLPMIKGAEYRIASSEKSLSIARGQRSPSLRLSAGISTGYSEARQEIDQITSSYTKNGGYALDTEGNQLPTYEHQSEYTYKTKPFSNQFNDNQSTYAMLSLSIPILSEWRTNTNIANAKIELENARYRLNIEKKQLYKTIQQKYLDAVSAESKYQASKITLEQTTELFNYTKEKFDVGMVNSLDYNIAKNKMRTAESKLLQAKYEYLFAVKILEMYSSF